MSFSYPRVLWALLAVVPILLVQMRAYVRGRRDLIALGTFGDAPAQNLFLVKSFFGSLAFDAFVGLAVVALAAPTWGERPVQEDRNGLDVVVAIDISRSMLATDVTPDRLDRGVSVIRSVSRQLDAARFAVVAFKGDATVLLPLTEDVNALEAVLDGISPNLVSTPGSDLERGLETALDAFPPGTDTHRAIVLVSDGESLSGTPGKAARLARDEGTPVITLLAGTVEGTTVPAGDGSLILGTDGRPVISRADIGAMQTVADVAQAVSLDVTDVNVVTLLIDALNQHVELRNTTGSRLVPVPRYATFLGGALVMLALSVLVRVIRWKDLF